jgi:Reverse transcriptase (RNA-dependent DNA polymerase)
MPTYKTNHLERIEVQDLVTKYPDVPLLVDDWTIAFRLGFTGKTFWYIVKNRADMYHEFMIKKKTGGLRRTFDPNGLMRVFQQQIRTRILLPLVSHLGPHVAAYQFGKSTVDAASMHIRECKICDETTKPGTSPVKHDCPRRGVKFKMDLKDFFISTKRSWIRKYFHEVVGYNHYASSLLGQLLTTSYIDSKKRHRNGVPPGALIAGDICNLIADWKIDQPMLKALPPGWRYTRYADDLYFSFDKPLSRGEMTKMIGLVSWVIRESGYRVNWKKLQVQHWGAPQRVLGININRKLNIPANEYRKLHMLLYKANQHGFEEQLKWSKHESLSKLHAGIAGKLNYFKRFAPEKTEKLRKLYEKAKATHKGDSATMFEFVNGEAVTGTEAREE